MIIYRRILILHKFIVGTWNQSTLNVHDVKSMLAYTFDGFDGTKLSIIAFFAMIKNFDGLIDSKHNNVG
jgi:hypothetical protein